MKLNLKTKIQKLLAMEFGNREEKDYFLENFALLLSNGIQVTEALDSIQQEIRSKSVQELIQKIKQETEEGTPLWKSLAKSRLFPAHVVSLIKIGEDSARLSENLKIIVENQQKERTLRAKIHSAMIYPTLVLSLSVILGLGIAWFILPRLTNVFRSLKIELPFLTRVLMDFGNFLSQHGWIFVPGFLLFLSGVIAVLFFVPKTKFLGQRLIFLLPGAHKIIQQVEVARFGFILGTLLGAGLPIIEGLQSLAAATYFDVYQKFYTFLQKNVETGNSFKKSFQDFKKASKLFPVPIQQMIVAAEQSGNLSNTLKKISSTFEAKTENSLKNFMAALEPMLLIFVWGGVVSIALAVILPIYSLFGGIGNSVSARDDAIKTKSALQQNENQNINKPYFLRLQIGTWRNIPQKIKRISSEKTHDYNKK